VLKYSKHFFCALGDFFGHKKRLPEMPPTGWASQLSSVHINSSTLKMIFVDLIF
jgi:hypothetical protein